MMDMLVRIVLWTLAAYHVLMGALALFAPMVATNIVRSLYGAALADSAPLRFATSMIGALALAIGGLAAVAALSPGENRPVIAALLVLQLCRISCRLRDRTLLAESFRVSTRSNMAAIALLGVESVILGLALG